MSGKTVFELWGLFNAQVEHEMPEGGPREAVREYVRLGFLAGFGHCVGGFTEIAMQDLMGGVRWMQDRQSELHNEAVRLRGEALQEIDKEAGA